jgi:hypothetical protein
MLKNKDKADKISKKKFVAVTCQCKDWAVPKPDSLLRKVQCPHCGKVFRTNRESNFCFKCEKKF